ncbi:MAG: TolC family protein [Rhodospirillaceae bacterium]|jgi:NodT family efflux transporter outer membrane factor (OMF) lipoprotein|nr:TolC family protein [Rhodospirillaceae bacterium]MBT6090125.1 TolC family protein [Rhodospirillaceae bacterium]
MIRFTPIAVVLVLLAACSSPNSSQQAGSVAQGSLPTVPDLWASTSERVGQVEVGWVAALNDPVLTALVEEAQQNSRNLQAAAANVERSWALARQAGAGLSPTVNLSSNADRGGSIEGSSAGSFGLGLQASWEVDVWGRIRSGEQAAVLSAQSVESDYVYSQYSLTAAVARAYFLAIEAGQQVDVARKTLDALTETNRIVDVRHDLGRATSQDVALSRSDLAQTKASQIAAEGSQRDALRGLEVLVGRYPAADLAVRTTLPEVPSQPPAGLPSSMLERRPDIVAAERSVAAAFNSLDQAKAARMPSISLTGSLGGSSSDLSNLLNPANIAWQAASSLVAPLIDGGLRKAQVDQATAEQKQAIANYAQAALDAFQEAENSLDQNVVLRERAASLKVAASEANRALRIVRLRYDEGETDLLDVLTIQQSVFSSDSNLVSVERARLDEWVGLNLALGGDWQ